jgi:cell division protein FtsB
LEKERKKTAFNLTRLLASLLLLFFVGSSVFYIGIMTLKMFSLREEIELKESQVSDLETGRRSLEAEINRLKAQEKVFADTLQIMQDDLPTLEVLNALETCMDYGMGLNSLRLATGQVAVVEATAVTEEQIIQLTDGLTGSGVFSAVTMPTSRRDDKTGRVSFTLNLTLLPIGQIKSSVAR